jgi:hypothetical protein
LPVGLADLEFALSYLAFGFLSVLALRISVPQEARLADKTRLVTIVRALNFMALIFFVK